MSAAVRSLNQTVMLIFSNGFVIGCVVGVILNLLIPMETDHELIEYEYQKAQQRFEKVGIYCGVGEMVLVCG